MKHSRHLPQALIGAVLASAFSLTSFAAPPVESPVGNFYFETPQAPPVAPYPITEMAYLAGSYVDGGSYLAVTVDLAMDESGKVQAMGILPGFRNKKDVKSGEPGNSENVRTLYVRTINGEPVLTGNATESGEYDDDGVVTTEQASASGKGQADIYLGSFPGVQDPSYDVVPVKSSFSGKVEADKDKAKPSMSYLYLDPTQVRNLTKKSWDMTLTISEKLDARSKKYYVASLILQKPDGTETRFAERRVTYSERGGYTIPFSNGTCYALSQPILDARGRPVKDKVAKINFANLLFKKDFDGSNNPYFTPAAGLVSYAFLGQKGAGHAFNFNLDY